MSEELIKELAQQIAKEAVLENATFYLLVFAITLVATAISSFIVSYWKKRGEAYATKQDFKDVLSQLEQSTEATENIRSEIVLKFSQENERRRIKRDKLEQIIECTYALELWLEQNRTKALAGETFNINESPLSRIEMILLVYFPDSIGSLKHVQESVNNLMRWMLELHTEYHRAKFNNTKPEYNIEGFAKLMPPFLDSLEKLRKDIIENVKIEVGL